MFQKLKVFLSMYSAIIICGIVTVIAPIIFQECEIFWYQEKEPEGIDDFFNKKIRNSSWRK